MVIGWQSKFYIWALKQKYSNQRENPNAIIALHPGTVDSELSKTFQKMWQNFGKLFSRRKAQRFSTKFT